MQQMQFYLHAKGPDSDERFEDESQGEFPQRSVHTTTSKRTWIKWVLFG